MKLMKRMFDEFENGKFNSYFIEFNQFEGSIMNYSGDHII